MLSLVNGIGRAVSSEIRTARASGSFGDELRFSFHRLDGSLRHLDRTRGIGDRAQVAGVAEGAAAFAQLPGDRAAGVDADRDAGPG
ncbi:hypothetical protein [Nocardia sp. NPDC052112]|uniref:hypothetical protein n=1 Tax=Nocardia sp. NPDC052112 TaxID=3155646 RepID=UPI00341623C9